MRRLVVAVAARRSARVRRTSATVAAIVLVLTSAGQAIADERQEALDSLPASAWRASITSLESSTTALDDSITNLQPMITAFETRATEGEETVITLSSDILFAFGESTIGPRAEARISELVAEAPEGVTVQVHGHTDSVSGREFNQQLSEERAATVASVIEEARPDLQLEVAGFGMDEPVEPNEVNGEDNPEGRALNRRVEIRYEG